MTRVRDNDRNVGGGIKAKGGVRDGVSDGGDTLSREAAKAPREAASREAAPRLGSLTMQNQISLWLGFCVGRVTPLIPGTFFVSADTNNEIYGIGWLNPDDTKNILYRLGYVSQYQQSSAYKYHPHITVPTEHHSGGGYCSDRDQLFRPRLPFLRYFFNFL
jgi:hypothetical protein